MAIIERASGGVVTTTDTKTGATSTRSGYGETPKETSQKTPDSSAPTPTKSGGGGKTYAQRQNEQLDAAREAYKAQTGSYPTTTSEVEQAKSMVGMPYTRYKLTPKGELRDTFQHEVIAQNVYGYVTGPDQSLKQITYKQTYAGPREREYTTFTSTGQLVSFENKQLVYLTDKDVGGLYMKAGGDVRQFDARLGSDIATAKEAGFYTNVPQELLPQTDWYYAQEEEAARLRGATALASSLEQELGEYLTFKEVEGGWEVSVLEGGRASVTPTVERAIQQYLEIDTYADVSSPEYGVFVIKQKEPSSVEYKTSKEFGTMFSKDRPVLITLDESYEPTVQLESGKLIKYSELTAGQKEAFKGYFGKNLEDIRSNINQQILDIRNAELGEAQSYDTGIHYVEKDGRIYLEGITEMTTFETTQYTQEQSMFKPLDEILASVKQPSGNPELAKLESRISEWDKRIDATAKAAWGDFESPSYQGPPNEKAINEMIGKTSFLPFGQFYPQIMEIIPLEVKRTIEYWPQRTIVDTSKIAARGGEMFFTEATSYFPFSYEKQQAPYQLMAKYPVETGLAAATVLVPIGGGALAGAAYKTVGPLAAQAITITSKALIPTIFAAGMTEYELQKGFPFPEAVARGAGTVAFLYGLGELAKGPKETKTGEVIPGRGFPGKGFIEIKETGIYERPPTFEEVVSRSREAKAEYLKTEGGVATIDVRETEARRAMDVFKTFEEKYMQPGARTTEAWALPRQTAGTTQYKYFDIEKGTWRTGYIEDPLQTRALAETMQKLREKPRGLELQETKPYEPPLPSEAFAEQYKVFDVGTGKWRTRYMGEDPLQTRAFRQTLEDLSLKAKEAGKPVVLEETKPYEPPLPEQAFSEQFKTYDIKTGKWKTRYAAEDPLQARALADMMESLKEQKAAKELPPVLKETVKYEPPLPEQFGQEQYAHYDVLTGKWSTRYVGEDPLQVRAFRQTLEDLKTKQGIVEKPPVIEETKPYEPPFPEQTMSEQYKVFDLEKNRWVTKYVAEDPLQARAFAETLEALKARPKTTVKSPVEPSQEIKDFLVVKEGETTLRLTPKSPKKVFTMKDIFKETVPTGGVEVKTSQGTVQIQLTKTETAKLRALEKVVTKTTVEETLKPLTTEKAAIIRGTVLTKVTQIEAKTPLDKMYLSMLVNYGIFPASTAKAATLQLPQVKITETLKSYEIIAPKSSVLSAEALVQPPALSQPSVQETRLSSGLAQPQIQIQPTIQPQPTRQRTIELEKIKQLEVKLPFLFPLGGGKEEKKKKKSPLKFTGKIKGKKSLYSDLLSVAQTELGVGAGRARHPSLKKHPELWKGEATGRIPTSQMLKLGGTRNALKSIRGNLFGKMKKVKYI